MASSLALILFAAFIASSTAYVLPVQPRDSSTDAAVYDNAPSGAGVPLEGFVSFSIEFSSFPDFAGNLSAPNTFSDNLLKNLGNIIGTKPYIRVGGNTQDFAYALPLYFMRSHVC